MDVNGPPRKTQRSNQLVKSLGILQTSAVEVINDGETTILLVGYAGTGKSTSSKAILQVLEEVVSDSEYEECLINHNSMKLKEHLDHLRL